MLLVMNKGCNGSALMVHKNVDGKETSYYLDAAFNEDYEFYKGILRVNNSVYEVYTHEELSLIIGDSIADALIIKAWGNISYVIENKTS